MNSIITASYGRIINTETVYETAKQMRGTFSVENMKDWVNAQLEDGEKLTKKQVASALNEVSSPAGWLQKVNAQWYRWG